MKRRYLLISLSASAFALAYGFHKQLAVAQLIQQLPIGEPLLSDVTRCPDGNGLFVLYYGAVANPPLKDKSLNLIVSKNPNFVIFADGDIEQRKNPKIPIHMHNSGKPAIRAIMYIALGRGQIPSAEIDRKIDEAMNAGYDGIFFDEAETRTSVHPIENPNISIHDWNAARAARVRSHEISQKKTTLVIFNPGIASPPQSIFNYADIVSVENYYDQKLPSYPGISPWRWLAVQGDPAGDPSKKAAASAEEAINRTITFRNNGGFWYYSSPLDAQDELKPTHTQLPSWYTTFADWVKSQPTDPCPNIVRLK